MPASFRSLLLFSLFAFALCGAIPLTGCGNNFSAPTGFVTRAVTFHIVWGPTNDPSAIAAPSNARAAILTLQKAKPRQHRPDVYGKSSNDFQIQRCPPTIPFLRP